MVEITFEIMNHLLTLRNFFSFTAFQCALTVKFVIIIIILCICLCLCLCLCIYGHVYVYIDNGTQIKVFITFFLY